MPGGIARHVVDVIGQERLYCERERVRDRNPNGRRQPLLAPSPAWPAIGPDPSTARGTLPYGQGELRRASKESGITAKRRMTS